MKPKLIIAAVAYLLLASILGGCTDATGPSDPAVAPTFAKGCAVPGHSSGTRCTAAALKAATAAATATSVCASQGAISAACLGAMGALATAMTLWEQETDAYGHRDGCDVYGAQCNGEGLVWVDIWDDPRFNPECLGLRCEQARDAERDVWWSAEVVR